MCVWLIGKSLRAARTNFLFFGLVLLVSERAEKAREDIFVAAENRERERDGE